LRQARLSSRTGRLAAGVFIALALTGSAAHAGFLEGKTYDNVTIDGTAYNVTFQDGSYDSVYSSTPPTFLNNESGAYDAIHALSTLFLLTPHNIGGPANNYDAAWVPHADNGSMFTAWITDNVSPPAFTDQTESDTLDFTPFLEMFAIFTPVNPVPPANPPGNPNGAGVPAPEPPGWASLGIALAALLSLRRGFAQRDIPERQPI
jgi:hypothetical protein